MSDTLTALEACAYLQVTWGQWKTILWRGVSGGDRGLDAFRRSRARTKEVFERDHAICHRCGTDTLKLERAVEEARAQRRKSQVYRALMAQIQAMGVPGEHRNFWVIELVGKELKTTCLFCVYKHGLGEKKLKKSAWVPSPVEGSWASKRALFLREDIERLKKARDESKRTVRHNV